MKYDVFISYAHEDKYPFVEALADTLKKSGLKVWFDDFELSLGDSLREKIEQGLAQSKYGVIILSRNFFKKEWPKRELDGFFSKEIHSKNKKIILPIWHDIDVHEIVAIYPTLADKVALKSQLGVKSICQEILNVIQKRGINAKEITIKYEQLKTKELKLLTNEIIYRFEQLVRYYKYLDDYYDNLEYDEVGNPINEEKFAQGRILAKKKFYISDEIYDDSEGIDKGFSTKAKSFIKRWVKGKSSKEECEEFSLEFDFLNDIDTWYVFYDVPNRQINADDYDEFMRHFIVYGYRNNT